MFLMYLRKRNQYSVRTTDFNDFLGESHWITH